MSKNTYRFVAVGDGQNGSQSRYGRVQSGEQIRTSPRRVQPQLRWEDECMRQSAWEFQEAAWCAEPPVRYGAGRREISPSGGRSAVLREPSQDAEGSSKLNPKRPRPQETLPSGIFRNAKGLLIRDSVSIAASALNMEQIDHESKFLKEHVVILQLVKERGRAYNGSGWLQDLEAVLQLGMIQHYYDAGCGFVYIKLDRPDSTRRVLALSPFRCLFGTVIFHRWLLAFNPQRHALFTPAWIQLHYLPLEYIDEADKVVGFVGRVLEIDQAAKAQSSLRYCVELYSGDPWTAKFNLASMGFEAGEVLIENEGDEIHCHCCLSFNHMSDTCQEWHVGSQGRTTTRHHPNRRRPSSERTGHQMRTWHYPNSHWSTDS
jgi:hypothetical protein